MNIVGQSLLHCPRYMYSATAMQFVGEVGKVITCKFITFLCQFSVGLDVVHQKFLKSADVSRSYLKIEWGVFETQCIYVTVKV